MKPILPERIFSYKTREIFCKYQEPISLVLQNQTFSGKVFLNKWSDTHIFFVANDVLRECLCKSGPADFA